jgi:hypothetical protein
MSFITSTIRLNLGLRTWKHHAAFWIGGVSGLYFGQVAMHTVLAPDESLPEVDEQLVMAKFLNEPLPPKQDASNAIEPQNGPATA